MTKDVSFEQEGKNSAGKLFYQKRRLKVEDENPFVIKVERSKDDGHEILARTVESGLLIAKDETDEDSSDLDYPRVESTFANVRWERDAGCMPVSGSISGEVYLDSSSTPSKTFTINFDGENTTITLPSGETTQFALGGCELDRPSTESEVSSADSAEDV